MARVQRANGNEPGFDLLYTGKQGEDWFATLIKANSAKIEIKCDSKFFETWNFYIEYQCLRQGKWEPSGIKTTKSKFWVLKFGEYGGAFMVEKSWLLRAARKGKKTEQKRGSHPTKGVLVTMQHLKDTARTPFAQNMFDEA